MNQVSECNPDNLANYLPLGYNSKCEFVKISCGDEFSFIDNASLYYCTFEENFWLFLPFSIIYVSIVFHLLSSTSENYLGPILSKLVKILKFSESLAGVTLLAFANGAPDIIASYTGNQEPGPDGIPLALGALFGAGIFTISIALSRVISISKKIDLIPNTFKRDVIFYILTSLTVLILGYIGEITIIGSFVFLLIYICFAIKAVHDEINKDQDDSLIELRSLPEVADEMEFSQGEITIVKEDLQNSMIEFKNNENSKNEPNQNQKSDFNLNLSRKPVSFKAGFILGERDLKIFLTETQVAEKKKNLFFKILGIYETAANFIRNLTTPNIEDSKYFKLKFAGYPLFTTLFILWRLNLLNDLFAEISYIVIFFNSILILCVISYLLTSIRGFQTRAAGPVYFLGFVISIFWIQLAAEFLMDFLKFIHLVSDLPTNFVGLTILAWGNSINDYFVDTSLARKGFGVMVVAAVVGGQFFNLTIGLAVVIFQQTLRQGVVKFTLFDGNETNNLNLELILSTLTILVVVLIYASLNKYTIQKNLAYFLIFAYLIFICMVFMTLFL